MTIIDPCATATIIWLSPATNTVYTAYINDPAALVNALSVTDSVSQNLGQQGFCGTYQLTPAGSNTFPLTVDALLQQFGAFFTDPAHLSTHAGQLLDASFSEYPLLGSFTSQPFDLDAIDPCPNTVINWTTKTISPIT